MKRNRFTDEQIIGILKEHEAGTPVSELCRKHGVSDASIYKWKAKFGGMEVSEAKRLKTLEDENTKLKRLLADAMLDVLPKLGEFLAERGLKLSEAKTKLVHISEGFNFLGFNIRTMSGKVLVKPQKEKVLDHLRQISTYLRSNRQLRTVSMVKNLNLVIRGWSLYYRYVVAKRTFATVDNAIWPMLYKWAKRRHPQKPLKWVAQHYFTNGVGSREWQLNDGKRGLLKHDFFKIRRWIKVNGRASPLDPDLRVY